MKRLLVLTLTIFIFVTEELCGINKTLNAAQQMFQEATTVAQYQAAKKKFQSAKLDVGYVAAEHDNAINKGIEKCDRRIRELSPRLSVNGNSSSTNISFSASGGSKSLTISTNQSTPYASALPSWITVSNLSSTSMTIYCAANTSTSSRNDWFNVNAGNQTVRVNVSQSGKSSSSSSSNSSNSRNTPNGNHSANIESVWIEQDVSSGGQQGLYVHVKFTVTGLNGKDGRVSTYYYDSSNNAIKDTNGSYCTTSTNKVASSEDFKPIYDNAQYNDFKVFIPYSELHQSGTSPRTINVSTIIWDCSTSDHKQLAKKLYTSFSFTPKADSYLKVNNKTAVSTSFIASGGTETFYISTDAGSWSTWGIPPFCEVTSQTVNSFTLKCSPNTGSKRSDYMKVKTGNHEVRIDITQSGKPKTATINNIWQDHNQLQDQSKGMLIHIKFETEGLKGHRLEVSAYFYHKNGNRLNDYDGCFRSADGQVSVGGNTTPSYDSSIYNDFELYIPYSQLHMGNQSGRWNLKFQVQIHDKTTGNTIASSDYQGFYYQLSQ